LPRIIGLGRALDLILTGRAVDANEALAMGLINRVVPRGRAREEAEALAATIATFPQACMRADRMSVYAALDLSHDDAMREELELGIGSLTTDGVGGARRFTDGEGRHGT
jgi:enoyl-CoA hydratase